MILNFCVEIDGFSYDDISAISEDYGVDLKVLTRFQKRAKSSSDFVKWFEDYRAGKLKVR